MDIENNASTAVNGATDGFGIGACRTVQQEAHAEHDEIDDIRVELPKPTV